MLNVGKLNLSKERMGNSLHQRERKSYLLWLLGCLAVASCVVVYPLP